MNGAHVFIANIRVQIGLELRSEIPAAVVGLAWGSGATHMAPGGVQAVDRLD